MQWSSRESNLTRAFLSLKNEAETRRFLRDLMTESEIREFSKRLWAAELLQQDVAYTVIEKKTGLSSATIARVSKWLKGKEGGYRDILDRLHHHGVSQAGRGLS